MSKINLECVLKSSEGTHKYEGKAVLKDGLITYSDDGVVTKIFLDDIIKIQRKKDYNMTLCFSLDKTILSEYITEHGIFSISVKTLELERSDGNVRIKYILTMNDNYVDTFLLNFKYSIDSDMKYV